MVRASELFLSWDESYKQLEEYKRVNMFLINTDNPHSWQMVYKQRQRKKNNKLSDNRIKLLDDIEFHWVCMVIGWDVQTEKGR